MFRLTLKVACCFALLATLSVVLGSSTSLARRDPVPRCRDALAKAGAFVVQAAMRAEQACARKVSRGRLPSGTVCIGAGPSAETITDEKTHARVRRAITKARVLLERRCGGLDLFAAPPSGLGFPLFCPAVDPSCFVPLDRFGAFVDCIECTHLAATHAALSTQYAGSSEPNPTPVPPAAPLLEVAFTATSVQPLRAFQLEVLYPGSAGAFIGAGEAVHCTTMSRGLLTKQHLPEQNRLIVAIADANPLTFPVEIGCLFLNAPGQHIARSDITLIVNEVTQNGEPGDIRALIVAVSVRPP